MNYFFSSFYPNILGAYIITYIVLLKRVEALSIGPQLLLLLFWVHVNLQVCLRLDDREIEPGVCTQQYFLRSDVLIITHHTNITYVPTKRDIDTNILRCIHEGHILNV